MSLNKPTHTAVTTTLNAVTQYLGYKAGELHVKTVICQSTDLGRSTPAEVALVVSKGKGKAEHEVAVVIATVTILWNEDQLGVPSYIAAKLLDQNRRERLFQSSISRNGRFTSLNGTLSRN